MKIKEKVCFILSLCMITILVGCGTAGQAAKPAGKNESASQEMSRVFKIAHIGSDSNIWTKVMNKFHEELAERSEGRLRLEIFPNAVFGNESEMMELLRAGSLDMAFITSAELTNRSGSFNAWFMPFVIKDSTFVQKMIETDEAKAILYSLSNEEGVHALGYNFIETRHILMKDSLIKSIDDIKGKKIRVTPSLVITDWWKSLGASPTPLPLPEVYSALQTGAIDGIDIGPMAVMTSNLDEAGKALTRTNHMVFTGVSFVSQKVWDELSVDDQNIIEAAFDEAIKYNLELGEKEENESFAKFVEQGGRVADIEHVQPILEKAEEFVGKYAANDGKIKAFVDKAKQLGSKE